MSFESTLINKMCKKQIGIYLDKEIIEQLTIASEKVGKKPSVLISEIITDLVNNADFQKKIAKKEKKILMARLKNLEDL